MRKRISESQLLSFTEHLEELRYRLLVSVLALVVAFLAGYFLAPAGLRLLIKPLEWANRAGGTRPRTIEIRVDDQGRMRIAGGLESLVSAGGHPADERFRLEFRREGAKPEEPPLAVVGDRSKISMIYLRPADPFMLTLKVALILGIILALPVLLWQAWLFVTPGLTSRERRWAAPVIISGSLLFPIGVAFAYYLLAYALRFFATYTVAGLDQQLDVRAYLGFALTTMVSFGTVFELPIAVLLATQIGLLSTKTLQRRRREVFVLVLVGSALLTPTTDPFTLMAMSLPLYGLFEISILITRLMKRPERESETPYETDSPYEADSPYEIDTPSADGAPGPE